MKDIIQKLDQYVMVIIDYLKQFFNWVEVLMTENIGMFFGVVLIIGFVAIILIIGLIRMIRKAFGLFLFLVVLIGIYITICLLFL